MGFLFDIPTRGGRVQDSAIAKKAETSAKRPALIPQGGGGILSSIKAIRDNVEAYLGKYKNNYMVIDTYSELENYVTGILKNGIYAIDTETTGLDPILDKIVGISIATYGQKPAYIPINHVSLLSDERLPNQLTVEEIKPQLERLVSAKAVMFNAKFDIRVIKNQCGVYLPVYWDCYIAQKLLNENEPSNGLKALYAKYILRGKEDAFAFDALFKGIAFSKIPVDVGYLYACRDAEITLEFYDFQRQFLRLDAEREDMRRVAEVFFNIEMPCIPVTAGMEDNGVAIDLVYAKELSVKYHKLSDEARAKVNAELKKCEPYIQSYTGDKLDNPVNVDSPTQLAILLYDVLQIEPVDKKNPRGTGKDILEKIDLPLCSAILELRKIEKLIGTYIDKMPELINEKTGRLHCSFNQYGAKTGRFSSSDPNVNWALAG